MPEATLTTIPETNPGMLTTVGGNWWENRQNNNNSGYPNIGRG